jgi:hypothetical protein
MVARKGKELEQQIEQEPSCETDIKTSSDVHSSVPLGHVSSEEQSWQSRLQPLTTPR